jgi:hypothetical protein
MRQCTVTAEHDILIGRLAANLNAAVSDRGAEQIRLTDIPFDSAAGGIAFQQPITYAKAAPVLTSSIGFPSGG